jgi:hypothetical protein
MYIYIVLYIYIYIYIYLYIIVISLADTCSSIVSPADSKPRARRHSTLAEGGAQPGPGTAG